MLLNAFVRKLVSRMFNSSNLGGLASLCQPSHRNNPKPSPFSFQAPFLELLESRLTPSVSASYDNGVLTIDASADINTTGLAVSGSSSQKIVAFDIFNPVGDTFNVTSGGDAFSGNGTNVLLFDSTSNPINTLNIIQKPGNDSGLVLDLNSFNGAGNINITGTGDGVSILNLVTNGNLNVQRGGVFIRYDMSCKGDISISGTGVTSTGIGSLGVLSQGSISAGGSISITGSAGGTSNNYAGIIIPNNITAGGSITLTGTGSKNGGANCGGVFLNQIQAGGNVTISGSGAGTGTGNGGVYLSCTHGGNTIFSGGNVSITGTGSSNGGGNSPGFFDNGGSINASGSVSITGSANGAGAYNFGVSIINGLQGSVPQPANITSGGNVSITGTGSSRGTDNSFGISDNGSSIKADGSVTISGSGRGSGKINPGVYLKPNITSGGNVSITGTGSSQGNNTNFGIKDANSITASGNISISGSGAGTGRYDFGTTLSSSVTSNSGNISITGTGSSAGGAFFSWGLADYSSINANGDVTITGSGFGSGPFNFGTNLLGNVTAGRNATINGNAQNTTSNPGLTIVGGIAGGVAAGGLITANGVTYSSGTIYSNAGTIVISGQNFNPVASNNVILFSNGVTGNVVSVSPNGTSMTVQITGGLSSLAAGTKLVATVLNSTNSSPYLVQVGTVAVLRDVSSSIMTYASALYHNPTSKLFTSTLTIGNTGNTPLTGNFFLVLQGLTAGVTLSSATITVAGVTYSLTITTTNTGAPEIIIPPSLLNSLARGASFSIALGFSNPYNLLIRYTPTLLSNGY